MGCLKHDVPCVVVVGVNLQVVIDGQGCPQFTNVTIAMFLWQHNIMNFYKNTSSIINPMIFTKEPRVSFP